MLMELVTLYTGGGGSVVKSSKKTFPIFFVFY